MYILFKYSLPTYHLLIALNIQSRFMFGVASANVEEQGSASLKELWMLLCISKYIQMLEQTLLPFLERAYPNGHHFIWQQQSETHFESS